MSTNSELDVNGPMACGCCRVEVADFGHRGTCAIGGRRRRDVEPALVDWPARFRVAAEVARAEGWPSHGNLFLALAGWMALNRAAVEAVGRALLGEAR